MKECEGVAPPKHIHSHISGIDLVESKGGEWYLLEDNLRVPSRASYPMIVRDLERRASPSSFRENHIVNNRDYADILKSVMDKSSFSYLSGITTVSTTAEEAFSGGKGVCQDFSNIMLGLLREDGIPSRYCCGLFKDAKESHGWIEVLSEGVWYGLDPANSRLVDDNYFITALGQDSGDTLLNKGIFIGGGKLNMKFGYLVVEQ